MIHYIVSSQKRIDTEWYTESQNITHDLRIARKAIASIVAKFCNEHPDWSIKFNTPDSFRAESVCGRFSTCFFTHIVNEIEDDELNATEDTPVKYIESRELIRILTTATDGTRLPDVDCDNFPRTYTVRELKKLVREMPAADVSKVKHGKWINASTKVGVNVGMKCSVCHSRIKYSEFHNGNHGFCHKCGAIMDN